MRGIDVASIMDKMIRACGDTKGNKFSKICYEMNVEGKRGKGRTKKRWLDSI
jgi:hypothetical protein